MLSTVKGKIKTDYDVIVIGGGHAGCEAYAACCRVGVKVALITPTLLEVGTQPCNPAVGGPGKGHLVREVVALGGLIGKVCDLSGIQFRTLNRRKGAAVRSTRVQTDSGIYVKRMSEQIAALKGSVLEDEAVAILWKTEGKHKRIKGVKTARSGEISARAVVVTTGTFLRGLLFAGKEVTPGGRRGAAPSVSLAESLEQTGLPMMRLKTGTCPRLSGDSIDISKLEEQLGETPPPFFSPDTTDFALPQRSCFLTYTGEKSHQIIAENLGKSSLYGGSISGIGPRYCPSIETKIARFPQKERHQIFLEPEDKDGKVFYPSGLSTSLPHDVQEEMVHAIDGLEKARIVRMGYAVEYDAFQPQCLTPTLEVDGFFGLFLSGQILGTSGYEEAAALGLLAGANAALSVKGEEPLILMRDQAYAGVMVDDLTGRGVDEPYRMFTSRAEFRLLLREDNAEERLVADGLRAGLIDPKRAKVIEDRLALIEKSALRLEKSVLNPSEATNDKLRDLGLPEIKKPTSLFEIIRRDGVKVLDVCAFAAWLKDISEEVLTRVEVDIKYSGYLERQRAQAQKLKEVDTVKIPRDMSFDGIPGLRAEIVEKLAESRPATLGQASRIPGITPAAIAILQVYLQRAASLK